MPATAVSTIRQGISAPLGASVTPDGVNFSIFSRDATAIDILLFDGAEDARPTRTVRLDAARHRTRGEKAALKLMLNAPQAISVRTDRAPR